MGEDCRSGIVVGMEAERWGKLDLLQYEDGESGIWSKGFVMLVNRVPQGEWVDMIRYSGFSLQSSSVHYRLLKSPFLSLSQKPFGSIVPSLKEKS